MRASKLKFGLRYLTHPTPKMVAKISKSLKRLLATLAGISYFTDNMKWVMVFAILGWLADELQDWFGEEQSIG